MSLLSVVTQAVVALVTLRFHRSSEVLVQSTCSHIWHWPWPSQIGLFTSQGHITNHGVSFLRNRQSEMVTLF